MSHRFRRLLVLGLLLSTPLLPAEAQRRPDAPTADRLYERLAAHPAVAAASRIAPANAAYQLDAFEQQAFDGAAWRNTLRIAYAYVGSDRSAMTAYAWDGTAWANDWRTVYVVEGGRLVEEQDDVWDGAAWAPLERTLYTYDGDQLTTAVYQEWLGDAWMNAVRTTLTWTDGLPTRSLESAWNGIDWEPVTGSAYEEIDGQAVQTEQTWNGATWDNVTRTTFPDLTLAALYDAILALQDDLNLETGFLFGLALPDYVNEEWSGTNWVLTDRARTEAYYDLMTGRLTESIFTSETWTGTDWLAEYRQKTTYDKDERASRLDVQFLDEATWTTFLSERLSYDVRNLLVSAVQETLGAQGMQETSRLLYTWSGTGSATDDDAVPGAFTLHAAYPNPFNPATTVSYRLEKAAYVTVAVYDLLGRRMATLAEGLQPAGLHRATFDATGLSSGVYLIRLEAPGVLQTRSVTLLK